MREVQSTGPTPVAAERRQASHALRQLGRDVEAFCASADPEGTKELGSSLMEQRRLINLLEIRFATTAGRFATPYEAESDAAGLFGQTATEFMRTACHMTAFAATAASNISEHETKLTESISATQAGSIGLSHLSWMASTANTVENSRTIDATFSEKTLLRKAKRLTVQQFRRQCEHFLHENDRSAFRELTGTGTEFRTLRLSTYGDGCVQINGFLDPEGGAAVCAALRPYADRHGADDNRLMEQRNADALVEACNVLLDAGALPRRSGERPHIHVTTNLETLLDACGARAAEMENHALLDAESVRRLACDATMVRVLLNSESTVVDVGRAQRVVPSATRRALNARDGGCVWPGCERTASRTQAHHMVHWADGGRTDLNNLISLCRRHHWMVHDGGYDFARTNNGYVPTLRPELGYLTRPRSPDLNAP